MSEDTSEAYKAKVNGWMMLFRYVQEVSKEIGEEKALDILSEVQTQVDKKWFDDNATNYDLSGPPLPATYNMIFTGISGRKLTDIKITEQTNNRIVHQFDLPCSILDACIELGLDTKIICKALHQKSANVLMQLVDPRLRFDRDYEIIRQ